MSRYLRIKNWWRYQHYRDRKPPWVKLHVDIHEEHEGLSSHARLLAFELLIVAANKDNRFPSNLTWIAEEVAMRQPHVKQGLKELLSDGFVEPWSVEAEAADVARNSASTDASGVESKGASKRASESARPSRARARSASVSEELGSTSSPVQNGSSELPMLTEPV